MVRYANSLIYIRNDSVRMFRSIKKRVQNIGSSVHGRSSSRHGTDQNNAKDSAIEQFNTPARKYSSLETSSSATVSTVSSGDTVIVGKVSTSSASRTQPLPPASSKRKSSRKSNKKLGILDFTLEELNVVSKIEQLASFDVCVQAADALAASSGQQLPSSSYHQSTTQENPSESDAISKSEVLMSEHRVDKQTGLPCTSVLVSPDGHMLLIPVDDEDQMREVAMSNKDSSKKIETELLENDGIDRNEDEAPPTASFANLRLQAKDDYQSAVFVGHDLHPTGDKALNNFSAQGWSIPATSLALEQTEQSLNALAHFFEQMILSRKEGAARTAIACDNLRQAATKIQYGKASSSELSGSWVLIDPRANDFEMAPNRTGPLLSKGSTLSSALAAFEEFYVQESEIEANRWRAASLQRDQILPKIHEAADRLHERSANRQQALQESSRRVQVLEDRMRALQSEADQRWKDVYQAEEKVTIRQRELMEERRLLREQARLDKMRQDESNRVLETTAVNKGDAALGATSKEIWDMVSSVIDADADPGSFEPMDLPTAPLSAPRDKSFECNSFEDPLVIASVPSTSGESTSSSSINNIPPSNSSDLCVAPVPMLSREEIAIEFDLPQLHANALAADQHVQDTADTLLNVLSTLDTTRRSARIAAETCLLSAANTQAASIETWIQLEKQALQERLDKLNVLESKVKGSFDVRSDLDQYITMDRKERGGSSHLGDDDDGGIASALAVLASHVDGLERKDGSDHTNQSTDEFSSTITSFNLDVAIDKIFDEMVDSDMVKFDKMVVEICAIAKDKSRGQRSRICYALNAKRSANANIKTTKQFDSLCDIFNAILTGCNDEIESGGVSNAKMCMMLAQTFYIDAPRLADNVDASRGSRKYVKTHLVDHPIWSKDDFWDIALTQQISESLANSGVMSNFDRNRRKKQSEYEKARKIRWYELNQTERIEISSQVHAVVSAQLGALAHSMIELGCGLKRAFAFVRRMSIRNQLPSSHRTMLLMHLMERDETDM